jgi:hypothetical protein
MKLIKNCKVKMIDNNGNRLVSWGNGITTCMWLDPRRANGATVGDRGQLEYVTTQSSGLWYFVKLENVRVSQ